LQVVQAAKKVKTWVSIPTFSDSPQLLEIHELNVKVQSESWSYNVIWNTSNTNYVQGVGTKAQARGERRGERQTEGTRTRPRDSGTTSQVEGT
jgi:hypothetical protein